MAQSINTTLSPTLLNSSLLKSSNLNKTGLMSLPTTKTTTPMYGAAPKTNTAIYQYSGVSGAGGWNGSSFQKPQYPLGGPNATISAPKPAAPTQSPADKYGGGSIYGMPGYKPPVSIPPTSPQNSTNSSMLPSGGTQPVATTQAPTGGTGGFTGTTTTPAPAMQTPQPVRGLVEPPKASTGDAKPKNQYSETVQGIVDKSQVTKDQKKMLDELRSRVASGESIADAARAISEKYATEIARVGQLGAGAVAGNLSTGTNVVGAGNAAIASQSASERMSALSAAQQAELAGNTQQLTANQQGISALTNALGAANTQQQLGITGLGTAAGYSQPSPAAYGQAVFNPLTGQYEGGGAGGLDPQSQASNLAQQVMSGAMTYDQAVSSLGYAGTVGTNFLNNAITAAGGNPLQLQAQGTAQQSNITTGGTAQTDIARIGLADATQNYVQMNTAAQYATQQSHAVTDILNKAGLNNVSSTDYNKAISSLEKRFSDVDRVAFNSAIIEARNAYSQLLSLGGGTPTGQEASAINALDSNQSAAAINASIQQLDAAVQRRLQSQYAAMQTYQQNMPTGTPAAGGGNYQGGEITWDSLLD